MPDHESYIHMYDEDICNFGISIKGGSRSPIIATYAVFLRERLLSVDRVRLDIWFSSSGLTSVEFKRHTGNRCVDSRGTSLVMVCDRIMSCNICRRLSTSVADEASSFSLCASVCAYCYAPPWIDLFLSGIAIDSPTPAKLLEARCCNSYCEKQDVFRVS